MATETTIQQIQENPEIEAYRISLLGDVNRFIANNMDYMRDYAQPPVLPPAYQVAGLTPLQQEAAVLARSGIGSYQPYMQAGLDAMRRGEQYTEDYGFGGLQEALGATRAGQQVLGQAADIAAAQRAQPYAYQQAAVADIGRAADMSRSGTGRLSSSWWHRPSV